MQTPRQAVTQAPGPLRDRGVSVRLSAPLSADTLADAKRRPSA